MMQKKVFSLPHFLSALSATFEISLNANYSGFRAEGCQYYVHGVLVQEGAWQMLPSEIIVETVEVALYRPTLVVCFDNILLFTVSVIGYDAAVGVPISSE